MTKNETNTPQDEGFESFKRIFLDKMHELDVPIYPLPDGCRNLKNVYGEQCFIVLGIPLSLTELPHKETTSGAESLIEVRIEGVRDEDFFFTVKNIDEFYACAKKKVLKYHYGLHTSYINVDYCYESSLKDPILALDDTGLLERITVNDFIKHYEVSLIELFIYIIFFDKMNKLKVRENEKRKIHYKTTSWIDEKFKFNEKDDFLTLKTNFEKVNKVGKYNAIMVDECRAKTNTNIILKSNKVDYIVDVFYSKLGSNTNIDLKYKGNSFLLSIQIEDEINFFEKCKLNLEYREHEILRLIDNVKLPFFGDPQRMLYFHSKKFYDIRTIKYYSLLLYNLDYPKNTINNTSEYYKYIDEELKASLYYSNYLHPEEDSIVYNNYSITLKNIQEYGIYLDREHRKVIYDSEVVSRIHKHIKDNFYNQEFGDDYKFFGKTVKQIINYKVNKYIKNIYKEKEVYKIIDEMVMEKFNGEILLKNFPWGIEDDEFNNEKNKKTKNQKVEKIVLSLYLYIKTLNTEIKWNNFYSLIGIISLLLNVDNKGDKNKMSQREIVRNFRKNNEKFKYWYEDVLREFLPVTSNENNLLRKIKIMFNEYIDEKKLTVMKVKVNDTSESDSTSLIYYNKLRN